jgi:hypothetical protein
MQHHIVYLRDTLHSLDQNVQATLDFFKRPEIKMQHVREILKTSAHYKDCIEDEQSCITKTNEILEFINSKNWHHHCWQLHDCHFHINFETFVACPFTCLSEIEEVLNKILKELYHA